MRARSNELPYRVAARAAMQGLRDRIAKLEGERNAAIGRADAAERQVRELERELKIQRRRTDAAEARLRSEGIDADA